MGCSRIPAGQGDTTWYHTYFDLRVSWFIEKHIRPWLSVISVHCSNSNTGCVHVQREEWMISKNGIIWDFCDWAYCRKSLVNVPPITENPPERESEVFDMTGLACYPYGPRIQCACDSVGRTLHCLPVMRSSSSQWISPLPPSSSSSVPNPTYHHQLGKKRRLRGWE